MFRCLSAALLLSIALPAQQFQIDHATVAGKSMQQMQANLLAIGIASAYGGAHTNHASEMALVSFPDGSYLELMAIQPNADPKAVQEHVWAKFLLGECRTGGLGAAGDRYRRGGAAAQIDGCAGFRAREERPPAAGWSEAGMGNV